MVQAPSNFGAFSNDLLVANHGNGQIEAYNITTGAFLGNLTNAAGQKVVIPGLKGLSFGNGALGGLTNTLYFTAGTNGGADGTMGSLSLTSFGVVADAPLQSSPDQPVAATEGQSFISVLSTFTDADPEGTVSDYVAVIDWGDGMAPTAGVITYNGSPKFPTFDVSGTHTYVEEGNYNYTVTVYDVGGSVTQTSGVVAVADAPLVVAWDSPPVGATLTEGAPISAINPSGAVAGFTDGNPFATVSDFTVSIEWGDGTVSPGVVEAVAPGLFDVAADHTYSEEGTYPAQITVLDDGGSIASAIGQMTVVDAPLTGTCLDITATEGQPLMDVTVLAFTDANPMAPVSDFTATIDWGDGTITQGTVVPVGGSAAGADFKVVGDHTYADEGTYTLTVAVADKGGASLGPMACTATVADAPLTDTQTEPIVATEGIPVPAGTSIASFQDNNPLATTADFTTGGGSVMVDYGDGLGPVPATITALGTGAFSISNTLSIVYPDEGTFPVNITVMDDGGSTILMSNVAYVADAPLIPVPLPALTGTEGTPLAVFPLTSVPIASFIDLNPLATVADFNGDDVDIDWGDSTHSDGTVTLVGGVFIVSGNHTYDEVTAPGTPPAQQPPYTITVTVHDDGGSVTSITNTAKIVDAPLSNPTAINVTGTEGLALVNVPLATFDDRNHFASVSDYNATIDWGDGTLLDRNTVVSIVGDAFLGGFPNTLVQVSGNHTYAEEGMYKIVVTILDIDNPANTLNATSVATINDAPLQNSVGAPSIPGQAGVALSVTNKGVPDISDFTDANPNATIADFPAAGVLIMWGDGTNSQGAVRSIGNAPGKTFIVSGNHTYASPGNYQIETFVTDVGGSRTVAFSEAIVTRAPLALPLFKLPFPLKAVEGLVFPGIVPLVIFVGSPGSVVGDFNAQIQFGDGGSAQGKIEDAGSDTSGEDYYVFAPRTPMTRKVRTRSPSRSR